MDTKALGKATVIYGGTFDPVHRGHLGIINHLKSVFGRVVVMPCGIPPHKSGSSATDRLNMLSRAGVEYDRTEIDSPAVSYTYLTVQKFEGDLYLCIGADSLLNFTAWKNPDQILDRAALYVVPRPRVEGSDQAAQFLRSIYGARVLFAPYVGEDISGTELRIRAAFGDYALLTDKVAQYIIEHDLYSNYRRYTDFERYGLKPSRIQHTKNTAIMAARLAQNSHEDVDKAVIAAILHDIGKSCEVGAAIKRGYLDRSKAGMNPNTVHAEIGAGIAHKDFGISDQEILDAIRYHATGRADMSRLEKITYLADLLEETNDFEGAAELRAIALEDIEKALPLALECVLEYVMGRGDEVDARTKNALDFYLANE